MKQDCLCIFGEVLFDHFPDGKRVLGGAPFNVAWHLQAFGQAPCFISRIGADTEGEQIQTAMQELGMRTDFLQIDPQRPTGRVSVSLIDDEPEYDIVERVAYDAISEEISGQDCRLLYHGSLALREKTSRNTLEQIKAGGPEYIFVDVNLRPLWWQQEQVLEIVNEANWVKLNTDELALLHPSSDLAAFIDEYKLQGLVLTHGAAGAELMTADGYHASVQPEEKIQIVDTVGAGDAFAAVIILGLVNDWPLEMMLNRAQHFASGLVGHRGATVRDTDFYQAFIEDWQLEN